MPDLFELRATSLRVKALEAQGFDVSMPEPIDWDHFLSLTGSGARQKWLAATSAVGLGCAFAVRRLRTRPYVAASTVLAGVCATWQLNQFGHKAAFMECLGHDVEAHAHALLAEKPDVVVGSTWGGAIAVQCLSYGWWRGPTVLLAPSQDRVADYYKWLCPSMWRRDLTDVPPTGVVILHGLQDTVVPVAQSETLLASSRWRQYTRLMKAKDEHFLHSTAALGRLGDCIKLAQNLHTRALRKDRKLPSSASTSAPDE